MRGRDPGESRTCDDRDTAYSQANTTATNTDYADIGEYNVGIVDEIDQVDGVDEVDEVDDAEQPLGRGLSLSRLGNIPSAACSPTGVAVHGFLQKWRRLMG
jgi:hypothetical protein